MTLKKTINVTSLVRTLGTVPLRLYRRAFTLIELLVVIAIIALLVSILLPSLQTAKDLAKRAVCMSNLHSMHLAYVMYDSENGRLPSMLYEAMGNSTPGYNPGFFMRKDGYWKGAGLLYSEYVSDSHMFYCSAKSSQAPQSLGLYDAPYGWADEQDRVYCDYWSRWCEWTVTYNEPVYERNGHISNVMDESLVNNRSDHWLMSDWYGAYMVYPSDYWIPHGKGLNVVTVGGEVTYNSVTVDEINSMGSEPGKVMPKLLGYWN